MISYKFAKKLKDAGFPMEFLGIQKERTEPLEDFGLFAGKPCFVDIRDGDTYEVYKIPTLSELIEACGEDFKWIAKYTGKDMWEADSWKKIEDLPQFGKALEEAVAKLWLKLNVPRNKKS